MTKPNRPLSEQEKADLVAYLDGELTGEVARTWEARLALNPEVRAEAESLKRTWDLLDFLPRPEPSPSFTERTVSKLRPVAAKKVTVGPLRRRRWRTGAALLAWAAGVALVFYGGYHAFQRPREPGEAELVRDLRLIENKRFYDLVEEIELLQALDQPDLFGDDFVGG